MNKQRIFFLFSKPARQCLALSGLLLSSALAVEAAAASSSGAAADSTQAILDHPGFREGLIWSGQTPPTESESAELLGIINSLDQPGWAGSVENFLDQRASSPWSPGLHHAYACFCRRTGRTTKALAHWEAAWNSVKNDTSDSGKRVGGMILGDWTDLLASLGRLEKLNELSGPGHAWAFKNPQDRERFIGAESSAYLMKIYPGVAYRCGTFALKAVGQALQPMNSALESLVQMPSPTNGFGLGDLAAIAAKMNLDLVPARRTRGQEIVVPSVVHWSQDHYAAILAETNGAYLVNDPTFGHPMWLPLEVINEEASGAFLIPSAKQGPAWGALARSETEIIRGRGLPNTVKDGKDRGCKNPGAKNCPCKGVPVFSVSEPYINLWISDEPISYVTSYGEEFTFRLSYKQRDTRPNPSNTNNTSQVLNTGWNNNWLSFIHQEFDPSTLINLSTTVYLADGGELEFGPVGNPAIAVQNPDTRAKLQGVTPNSIPTGTSPLKTDDGNTGWRLTWPDGSQDIYGYCLPRQAPAGDLAYRDFIRTRHIDPHGRTTWIAIEQVLGGPGRHRIKTVADPDGRTNTFAYDSNSLLIGVTNAYGLNAGFGYDTNKNLVRLTDAAGMTSTLTYDTNFYPTKLVTPYGTNQFEQLGSVPPGDGNMGGESAIARAIRITEPTGATSLYAYRYGSSFMPSTYPSNEVPTNTPISTLDDGSGYGSDQLAAVSFRNSFYWNSRQYASLSTNSLYDLTAPDYLRARMRHWLQDTNALYLSGLISIDRDPSPDGTIEGLKTFYDYQGKTYRQQEGTNMLPSVKAWCLPGGETHYEFTRFDDFGNVTNAVTTYTTSTGLLATRTNQYVYALNTYTNVYGALDVSSNIINTATNTFTIRDLLTQVIGPDGKTNGAFGGFDGVTWSCDYVNNQTNRNLLMSARLLPRYATNALGEVRSSTFTGFNKLSSRRTPAGLTTTNLYDSGGFLSRTIDLEIGRTNSFSYTTNGLLYAYTNELGLVTTNTWDNLLRLTSVKYPDGSMVSNVYNRLDLSAAKDRLGNWTYAGYDGLRHLVAVTNVNNAVTRLGWCGCGSLETITNAVGQVTTFFYDNQLRRTETLFADSSSLNYQYDLAGHVTNLFDGAGHTFTIAYNNQQIPVAVSNAIGRVNALVYDIRDRATQVTDANSVTITNTYDLLNRVLTRGYPDGGIERFGYTTNVLARTSYTNQLGSNVVNLAYDNAGRLTNEVHPGISTNQFSYNAAGEILTLTDGKNQVSTWRYDAFGRNTNKLDAASNEIFRFQYDPNDRLTNRWTPAKGTTVFRFDPVGNLTNVDYPLSPDVTLQYDPLNQLTNMLDAAGTTRFTRTAIGQLASEDGPWSNDTVSYGYTARQRTSLSLLQPSGSAWAQAYAYDGAGRLTNTTSVAGAFSYAYDTLRSILVGKLGLPGNSYITNNYDAVARLLSTALKNSAAATLNSHAYIYDLAGDATKQTFKDGNYADYGYDLVGELTSVKGKESGGATARLQEQLSYLYDPAGNLAYRTNNALTQAFAVNNLNELSSAVRSGTFTVAGDTTGPATNVTVNMLAAARYADSSFAKDGFTLTGGSDTFTAVAQNAQRLTATNQITVSLPATNSFVYDLNGNLRTNGTQIYDYDDENQLTTNSIAAVRKSEFVYDGLARRRISRDYAWQGGIWVQTNETRYVYDGLLPIQERDASNAPKVTYTRGRDLSGSLQGAGGIGALLARSDTAGSAFYGADGSGNVTALVNASGALVAKYAYDPFGNMLAKNGPLADANTYRFSSKEFHAASGLFYYGFRFYDPNLQRWLNRDPSGEWGGLNLYSFLGNNPVNWIDAYGLNTAPSLSGGLGAVLSTIIAGGGEAIAVVGAALAPLVVPAAVVATAATAIVLVGADGYLLYQTVDLSLDNLKAERDIQRRQQKFDQCKAQRTAEENKKARQKYKNNKPAARQGWEDREDDTWPRDANGNFWPGEHTPSLKEGGDPMIVTPRDPGAPDPHNIPGPDGLTDYQRWGALGPPARKANK